MLCGVQEFNYLRLGPSSLRTNRFNGEGPISSLFDMCVAIIPGDEYISGV